MASGHTKWTSAFDIDVTAENIVVAVRISLMVPKALNRTLLEANIAEWKTAIDATWNNRFYIKLDQAGLPIKFDIRFTHFRPHHRVVIHPGNWIANQHSWYIDTPAAVVAHEIGHMLGAYDEYKGGALAPQDPRIDSSSIMGGEPSRGVAYPRHLALLQQRLIERFDDSRIKIIAY